MPEENGIERTLGKILATQEATNNRIDDFRQDFQKVYEKAADNKTSVVKAHTRIDDMKEDINTIQKKSTILGGGAGGMLGIAGAFVKDFFGGN